MTFMHFADELARKFGIKDGATLVNEHKKRFSHQLNGEWRGKNIANKIQEYLGRNLESVRILDIGAGYGGCSVELKKLGADVVSIDVDPEAKRLAEIYSRDVVSLKYHIVEADSPELLKFVPEKSIDIILMTSVIEHIADIDNLLANSRLVLDNEGVFFTVMPNGLNHKIIAREPHCGQFGLSILPAQAWHRYAKNTPFVYYRTFDQYESIFSRYGFDQMFILPSDNVVIPPDNFLSEAVRVIEAGFKDWLSGDGRLASSESDVKLLRSCIDSHLLKMKHNANLFIPPKFNLVYGLDTWWSFYKKI